MKAQKETKWVCIQLSWSWRPRAFWGSPSWNIQAKFYNEKFPLVYESDNTWDSLSWRSWCLIYKHKCAKRIVALSLLSFSLIFLFSLFLVGFFGLFFLFGLLWPLLFFIKFGDSSQCEGIIASIIFPHMGQSSNNDDHHTLFTYNSISRAKIWLYMNASGGVPGCAMI